MRRGDVYRVRRPPGDPKPARAFVVVSRQTIVDSRFPTVVCAPIHTIGEGLSTQVAVGVAEGLKHPSWVLCDALVSLPKDRLTDFLGALPERKLAALRRALAISLDLV